MSPAIDVLRTSGDEPPLAFETFHRANDVANGHLSWSPREANYHAAIALLRIVSGGKAYNVRVVLK